MGSQSELAKLIDEGIASVAKKQSKTIEAVHREVGEHMGYSSNTVGAIKRGARKIRPKQLEQFVRYCLKNGRLNHEWTRRTLSQGNHPNKENLLVELFSHILPDPSVMLEDLTELETPGGAVKLQDPLYLRRKADEQLEREIIKLGTTTTIHAPRQTGKTSLLIRGLQYALRHEFRIVHLNIQSINQEALSSINTFLYFLAYHISDLLALDLDDEIEKIWRRRRLPNVKLTTLMERSILTQIKTSLILAIDEADQLLFQKYSTDFFGLLRAWHNARASVDSDQSQIWSKFNIVQVISTEPYLLIKDPRQSPFNVGLKLYLKDFDEEQIQDLNERHKSPLSSDEVSKLFTLLNGHPYLTRLAFYTLVNEKISWNQLDVQATNDPGPFSEHLGHHFRLLQAEPDLKQALGEIITHNQCPDGNAFFRLLRAGLVEGTEDNCRLRCDLYYRYFEGN